MMTLASGSPSKGKVRGKMDAASQMSLLRPGSDVLPTLHRGLAGVGISTEAELLGVALALGASAGRISAQEKQASALAAVVPDAMIWAARSAIQKGQDPLGDALCALRSPEERRPMGATYTPQSIVAAMTKWVGTRKPSRVVDPGCGSGRFIVAAGRAFRHTIR